MANLNDFNAATNLIGLTIVAMGVAVGMFELHLGKDPAFGGSLVTGGVGLITGHAIGVANASKAKEGSPEQNP
jgi:hypothetical protein